MVNILRPKQDTAVRSRGDVPKVYTLKNKELKFEKQSSQGLFELQAFNFVLVQSLLNLKLV